MDPDPTPDPISLLIDFKDAKNIIFLNTFFCLNVILQSLFQFAQHIYEKREGSGAGSATLTNGSGSGRPKNKRIPKH
jgi:hypothetical protein